MQPESSHPHPHPLQFPANFYFTRLVSTEMSEMEFASHIPCFRSHYGIVNFNPIHNTCWLSVSDCLSKAAFVWEGSQHGGGGGGGPGVSGGHGKCGGPAGGQGQGGLVHWMSAVMAEHMNNVSTNHHDGIHYMWNSGVESGRVNRSGRNQNRYQNNNTEVLVGRETKLAFENVDLFKSKAAAAGLTLAGSVSAHCGTVEESRLDVHGCVLPFLTRSRSNRDITPTLAHRPLSSSARMLNETCSRVKCKESTQPSRTRSIAGSSGSGTYANIVLGSAVQPFFAKEYELVLSEDEECSLLSYSTRVSSKSEPHDDRQIKGDLLNNQLNNPLSARKNILKVQVIRVYVDITVCKEMEPGNSGKMFVLIALINIQTCGYLCYGKGRPWRSILCDRDPTTADVSDSRGSSRCKVGRIEQKKPAQEAPSPRWKIVTLLFTLHPNFINERFPYSRVFESFVFLPSP
ncbi:hypothetical protein J6590_020330 [Homalodisca vitripennis]|nr:hypothetical protein J6590_020330 [Homalodisca vitripennis]